MTTLTAAELGIQLAKQHLLADTEHYGLDFDTWLGPVHQPNEWKIIGQNFLASNALVGSCKFVKKKNIYFGDIDNIIQTSANILAKHNPKPSLLHGNLWVENCATTDNHAVTYDPACYWGDRECDIAFTELFQPFPCGILSKIITALFH